MERKTLSPRLFLFRLKKTCKNKREEIAPCWRESERRREINPPRELKGKDKERKTKSTADSTKDGLTDLGDCIWSSDCYLCDWLRCGGARRAGRALDRGPDWAAESLRDGQTDRPAPASGRGDYWERSSSTTRQCSARYGGPCNKKKTIYLFIDRSIRLVRGEIASLVV